MGILGEPWLEEEGPNPACPYCNCEDIYQYEKLWVCAECGYENYDVYFIEQGTINETWRLLDYDEDDHITRKL